MTKKITLPSEKIFKKGLSYFSKGKYNLAREEFLKAISLSPENELYLLYAGLSSQEIDDLSSAERLFLKALKIDPKFASCYILLGLLYAEKGFLSKESKVKESFLNQAIFCYQKALEINPQDKESKEFLKVLKTYEKTLDIKI